jgi:hypothetical protein
VADDVALLSFPQLSLWLNGRMPDAIAHRRIRRNNGRQKRFFTRWWFWLIIVVVVLALVGAYAAWVGSRALAAKEELETAQSLVSEMKTQALAFDIEGAVETYESVATHTGRAVELANDPFWKAGESVPFAGPNLRAVRELAEVTDAVVTDVVSPLMDVAGSLDPAALTPKDGALDVAPFVAAVPALAKANEGLVTVKADAEAIQTEGTIDQVAAAQKQITGLLTQLDEPLALLNQIVPLLGPALGSDGPRNYVIMFQNPAEARALGGTALSFALVKVDQGKIELQNSIAAGYGNFTQWGSSVVPPPDGVEEIYGTDYGIFIANVTVRPSFPDTARITQEMWLRQFGFNVDGIVSIDPVALSYILRATDPIPLSSGDVLAPDTLVPLLLNTVYQRYNSGKIEKDNIAQDAVYSEAVAATFGRLTSGPLDPKALIEALLQGTTERRILMYSARPEETAQLSAYGLTGDLPVSDATTDRVGVYFQDNVGAKMNYYLQQAVHLSQAVCRPDGRSNYRVSVDLTNAVDPAQVSAISPSILGMYKYQKVKKGDQRLVVMIYAPPGSEIVGAGLNGKAQDLDPYHDEAYPVRKMVVPVPAGKTVSLSYDIVASAPGVRALEAVVTPLVSPTAVDTTPLDCATVPAG